MSAAATGEGPVGPETERESPYFGLEYYDEQFGEWLFGREAERDRIITNLRAARLTLLHAESGVGKSSLLRAGVAWQLDQLAQQGVGRRRRARYIPIVYSSWKDDPTTTLIAAIGTAIEPFLTGGAGIDLPGGHLDEAIETAARAVNANLLVILDQFEEYFLYSSRESPPERFADELARCINRADLPASFLISIREDAYAGLGDLFKGRISNVYGNYLHVDYLDRASARAAIRRPLLEVYNRQPGVDQMEIEDALVEAVLDQAQQDGSGQGAAGAGGGNGAGNGSGAGAIATPLLQLVMETVRDRERTMGSRVLRLSTLQELEGAERILDTHLKKALDSLDVEQRQIAIDCFDHLVTPSGGKIAEAVPDLALRTGHEEQAVSDVLDTLDRFRIVRPVPASPGKDAMRFRRYEIFHDVLAPAINRAITAGEEERLARERNEARVRARLERARALRFRAVAGVAIGFLILALAAMVGFIIVWRTAIADKHNAESLQLASAANANLGSDPELSALLAMQAVKIDPTRQAASALAEAVPAVQELKTIAVAPAGTSLNGASFSPDAGKILAALGNGTAVILSAKTGARLLTIKAAAPGAPVNTAVFNSDGTRVLTADNDGTARIFDARTGRLIKLLNVSSTDVESATYSADGSEIATTDDESSYGYVKIYSASGVLRRTIQVEHVTTGNNYVVSVALSHDGTEVATANGDDQITVFAVSDGKPLSTMKTPDNSSFSTVAFDPDDSRYLASADIDGRVIYWDTVTGKEVSGIGTNGSALDAEFSPDGTEIVTANDLGQAAVRTTSSGTNVAILTTHAGIVHSAVFSPDGGDVLTANEDGTVKIWAASPRELLHHIRPATAPVSTVVFIPHTPYIAAGDWTGRISIWNPAGSTTPRTLQEDPSGVAYLVPAPSGAGVIAVNDDGSLRLWSLSGKGLMHQLAPISGNNFGAVAYGPQPKELFVGYQDGHGDLDEPGTGKQVKIQTGTETENAAFFNSGGSQLLTVNYDGSVILWNARTGKRLRTLADVAKSAVEYDGEFSHDGKLVVVADDLGNAAVFDAATGKRLAVLNAESGQLNRAAFAPHNDYELVTAGDDGTARIWDWKTNSQLEVFSAPESGAMNTVQFSPDGSEVVTGSVDGTEWLWSTRLATPAVNALVRSAQARVTRGLSPAERARYLSGIG